MTGCYHQAAGALGGNGWNEFAVTEAQNFLRRALELDGDFALAKVGCTALVTATCVYRKLKHGRSGDEVRPGWRVH